MKVLLDNNVRSPSSATLLSPIMCCTAAMWEGLANGRLVRTADTKFDAMVTVDKNMAHQTSLAGLSLIVLVLDAKTNKVENVLAFA